MKEAAKLFNGPLAELLVDIKRQKEQTIDNHNLDKLTQAEWAGDAQANAEAMVAEFSALLQENQDQITALVALIRRASGIDPQLATFDDAGRKNFQNWIMQKHAGTPDKFTPEQTQWLQMIRDHLTNSFHCHRDDLEMAPFDAAGGMGKMYQLVGDSMDHIIYELNEHLVA